MPRIPLEDNFDDVINKAQRGLGLADDDLAQRAGVSEADLAALKAGRPHDAVLRRVARHLRLNPNALEALAHHRWYPEIPAFPRGFAMFNTPYRDMRVNSYLLWDSRDRIAVAFDAGTDCRDMLDTIEAERLRLAYIFVTHNHGDHIADLPRLAAAHPAAEVWTHGKEPLDLPGTRAFEEGVHFHAGRLDIKTLLTSGHSPGMTTYFVGGLSWPVAVVGDAIFASSMGGTINGVPAEFAEQYDHNVKKILPLPRDTVIAPGHGPLTTLAQEKKHNPFFAR
jgi:glyoxylase-like metal-dependent hydrolase (beta-lactamase superfamily II)